MYPVNELGVLMGGEAIHPVVDVGFTEQPLPVCYTEEVFDEFNSPFCN